MFARNDVVALGALSALNVKGIRVPEEVSVIGFDNMPATEFWSPGLTTVDARMRCVVREGTRQLVDLIVAPRSSNGPTKTYLEPRLVVRSSTQAAPAEACRGERSAQ